MDSQSSVCVRTAYEVIVTAPADGAGALAGYFVL